MLFIGRHKAKLCHHTIGYKVAELIFHGMRGNYVVPILQGDEIPLEYVPVDYCPDCGKKIRLKRKYMKVKG